MFRHYQIQVECAWIRPRGICILFLEIRKENSHDPNMNSFLKNQGIVYVLHVCNYNLRNRNFYHPTKGRNSLSWLELYTYIYFVYFGLHVSEISTQKTLIYTYLNISEARFMKFAGEHYECASQKFFIDIFKLAEA